MHKKTKSPAVNKLMQFVLITTVAVEITVAKQQNINQPPTQNFGHTLTNMDGTVASQQHNS